jgi:hypothetical protein
MYGVTTGCSPVLDVRKRALQPCESAGFAKLSFPMGDCNRCGMRTAITSLVDALTQQQRIDTVLQRVEDGQYGCDHARQPVQDPALPHMHTIASHLRIVICVHLQACAKPLTVSIHQPWTSWSCPVRASGLSQHAHMGAAARECRRQQSATRNKKAWLCGPVERCAMLAPEVDQRLLQLCCTSVEACSIAQAAGICEAPTCADMSQLQNFLACRTAENPCNDHSCVLRNPAGPSARLPCDQYST